MAMRGITTFLLTLLLATRLAAAEAPSTAPLRDALQAALDAYHAGAYRMAMVRAKPLAESGLAAAQYLVGVMLETGQGQRKDEHAATEWYRRAAEQNHLESIKRLALIHFSGAHMWTSKPYALLWFRRAAELGDVASQGFLGRVYANGWGIAADPVEAYVWFSLAAAHGNPTAARDLERLATGLSDAQRQEAERRIGALIAAPSAGQAKQGG
jgi:TPR repeat protein